MSLQRLAAELCASAPNGIRLLSQEQMQDMGHSSCRMCRPVTLQRLLELRQQHPEARLVVGHTEVGIERKYQQTMPAALLSAACVPELSAIKVRSPCHLGLAFPASWSSLWEQTVTWQSMRACMVWPHHAIRDHWKIQLQTQ